MVALVEPMGARPVPAADPREILHVPKDLA
jgi:hypothetical protein